MNLPASDGVAHLELAAGVHTEPDDLIGQRVAHNLLRLRGKRNLSLDALARISGVSRAMLAQIESGRSVPSSCEHVQFDGHTMSSSVPNSRSGPALSSWNFRCP